MTRCPVHGLCPYGCQSPLACEVLTHGVSRTVLPAGSAWPFPTGPVKPPRPQRGPDPEIEEALL